MAQVLQYIKVMRCSSKITIGKESGFSLVELLIVTALIAIIGAISIPMLMQQRPKWHMKGVAKDFYSKITMARLRAIQENKEYSVVVTTGAVDGFTVYKYVNNAWTAIGGAYQGMEDVDITLNPDVMDASTGCLSDNRIKFYPNGMALYSQTIPPVNCSTTEVLVATVSEKSGRFTPVKLKIEPATGIIRLY